MVGSQAGILYADAEDRSKIAMAFNTAINTGEITAPIVLGRDHHDVGGTDSPFRETSNIYDGSKFTADMAIHNVIGDSFRGRLMDLPSQRWRCRLGRDNLWWFRPGTGRYGRCRRTHKKHVVLRGKQRVIKKKLGREQRNHVNNKTGNGPNPGFKGYLAKYSWG